MPPLRAALYWAPDPQDPLATAGDAWLGRSAELNAAVAQPDLPGLAQATSAPSHYGFHATLRPPMQLATGWAEFLEAADAVARSQAVFDLPPLQVTDLDGFLALREARPCPALHALADACVAGTDMHRLRMRPDELARRRVAGLSAAQDALLLRWGYPHVMQAWRFHMTLSGRLTQAEMARLRPAAEAHFAAALVGKRRVGAIAVFTQVGGEPFVVAERLELKK